MREPLPLSCPNPEQLILHYVPYRKHVCYGRYLDFAAHPRYVRMNACMCTWYTTYAATIYTKAYNINRGTLALLATCNCTLCFFCGRISTCQVLSIRCRGILAPLFDGRPHLNKSRDRSQLNPVWDRLYIYALSHFFSSRIHQLLPAPSNDTYNTLPCKAGPLKKLAAKNRVWTRTIWYVPRKIPKQKTPSVDPYYVVRTLRKSQSIDTECVTYFMYPAKP